MIEILKASAGSGKTYALSHKYIGLLMENPDEFAYRKILAVTFTNKATDEMKGRILKDLHDLSKDGADPRSAKAGRVLSNILHDYSAFAISTIDAFFQRTLRAFAREAGQYASYQVELDKRSLTDEAVDMMLDGLDPDRDKELIGFILESMEEKVSDEKSLNIDAELKEMAARLKSEDFSIKARALGIRPDETYSTLKLGALKKCCRDVIREFNGTIVRKASEIVSASLNAGIQPKDYNRAWFVWFEKFAGYELNVRFSALTDSFREKASDRDKWFAKSKASLLDAAVAALGGKVDAFMSYWDGNFRTYNTAFMILSNVYGLGVAARLYSIFDELQKEKNLVCLDESNGLLKEIIGGSDAPFVYEKVGVWIDHYLLDEFQDTSLTQWDNFLPLLRESNSRGNYNLIVGDVKQSIYRWRESDWSLLDSRVQEEFPDARTRPMSNNYRSAGNIIAFNNDFYSRVAPALDSNGAFTCGRPLAEIYSDVRQNVGKPENADGGDVQVCFCENAEDEPSAVMSAVSRFVNGENTSYGDIAILVRTRDSGTKIADKLIEAGIPVVTEDSLYVKNSVTVRRLVSLMAYMDNPQDKVNGYFASSFDVSRLPHSYHNICGLCEELYQLLLDNPNCREDCRNEHVYVTAFMDYMMDYTGRHGNNLRDFLKLWHDANPAISSALDGASVKILTIHKSKGLDFPCVIVPFVEKIELYHSKTKMWCCPDVQGTSLEEAGNKLYYVGINSSAADTAFDDSYQQERYAQCVDAVNMMYVATTRASKSMVLIGVPGKDRFSNFADILNWYCAQDDMKCSVVPFAGGDIADGESPSCSDAGRPDNDSLDSRSDTGVYPLEYRFCPIGNRLSVRPYAADFFTEDNNSYKGFSYRQKGIVLHDILSRTECSEDLEYAVDEAVVDGSLPSAAKGEVMKLLSSRIASHPEFFPVPSEGMRVLREMSIIDADGYENRPDRVILYPGGKAVVVDYKFGSPKSDYTQQLSRYAGILRRMGWGPVEAYLWYVYDNKLDTWIRKD